VKSRSDSSAGSAKDGEGERAKTNVLVVGCHGMLGTDLMAVLAADPRSSVCGVDVPEIDITRPASVNAVVKRAQPGVIVNCAAYTDVDGCESHRDLAFAVNATGPGLLARAAAGCGATLVHISTDFVFDGCKAIPYVEEDPPCPISAYGESKLLGERAVVEQTDAFVILRTAWLYGRHGRNFVETMRKLGRERDELRVVTDQMGSPTYTVHLAAGIAVAIRKRLRGLFHLTNAGCCMRLEWARKVFELDPCPVNVLPATSDEFPRPARRPANSALDCARFIAATGHEMPPWEQGLAEYLAESR